MVYKFCKKTILESYEDLVKRKTKEIGAGQLENPQKVEDEMNRIVKQNDIDDSHPPTEYYNTIYDNDDLKELRRSHAKNRTIKINPNITNKSFNI